MVKDLREALDELAADAPPWRTPVDEVVVRGRRARRRRQARLAAGSSVAAVLATGTFLAAPAVLAQLTGTADRSPAALGGGSPPATSPATSPATTPAATTDTPAATVSSSPQRRAFLEAGYDDRDAALLARLWGRHGHALAPADAVTRAGDKLIAGGTLPVEHGDTPATVSPDGARTAFFENGYDYEDSVRLGTLWKRSGTDEVKIRAGRLLLAGERLPLAP